MHNSRLRKTGLIGLALMAVVSALLASPASPTYAAFSVPFVEVTADDAPLTTIGFSDGVCVTGAACNTRVRAAFDAASEFPGLTISFLGPAFSVMPDASITDGATTGDFTGLITVNVGSGCVVPVPLSAAFLEGTLTLAPDTPSATAALGNPFSWPATNLGPTAAAISAALGGAPMWRRAVGLVPLGAGVVPVNQITYNLGPSGFATASIVGDPTAAPTGTTCTPFTENFVARGTASSTELVQSCVLAGGPDAAHGMSISISGIPPSTSTFGFAGSAVCSASGDGTPTPTATATATPAPPDFFYAVDLDGNCATTNDTLSVGMTVAGTSQTIGVCAGGVLAFPAPGLATVGYDLAYLAHVSPVDTAAAGVPDNWTINFPAYYGGDGLTIAPACAVNNTTSPDASIGCNLPGASTGPTTPGLVAWFDAVVCETADGAVAGEALTLGGTIDMADAGGNAYDPITLIHGSLDCTAPNTATNTPTPTDTPTPTNTPTPTATPANPCLNGPTVGICAEVQKEPNSGNLFICNIGSSVFCDGQNHFDPLPLPGNWNGAGAFQFDEVAYKVYSTGKACATIPGVGTPTPVLGPGGDCNGTGIDDGLGAYEFQIKFDHKIFDVAIDDVVFDVGGAGAARAPADCSFSVVTENYILFGCVTTGSAIDGPSGPGPIVLAHVTLTPNADLKFRLTPGNNNGLIRPILDENCELADIWGEPVHDTLGGATAGGAIGPNGGLANTCKDAIITVRILEGDLSLDCVVDVTDAQSIAFRYGGIFGTLLYDPWFDLEPALKDFDVDIKDLQKVFGRVDSNCWDPKPDQPPLGPVQGP